MNNSQAHSALIAEILSLCGSRNDCRLWQNNTGVGRGLTGDGIVRFGLRGSADIIGIGMGLNNPITGVFLAIEAKTGKGAQTTEQKFFQAMIEKFGGYYLVARNANDVKIWLDRVLG